MLLWGVAIEMLCVIMDAVALTFTRHLDNFAIWRDYVASVYSSSWYLNLQIRIELPCGMIHKQRLLCRMPRLHSRM